MYKCHSSQSKVQMECKIDDDGVVDWLYLFTLVKSAGKLDGHPEPAKFDWSTILFAGKKNTMWFDVTVDDVIVMAILQSLKIMST